MSRIASVAGCFLVGALDMACAAAPHAAGEPARAEDWATLARHASDAWLAERSAQLDLLLGYDPSVAGSRHRTVHEVREVRETPAGAEVVIVSRVWWEATGRACPPGADNQTWRLAPGPVRGVVVMRTYRFDPRHQLIKAEGEALEVVGPPPCAKLP